MLGAETICGLHGGSQHAAKAMRMHHLCTSTNHILRLEDKKPFLCCKFLSRGDFLYRTLGLAEFPRSMVVSIWALYSDEGCLTRVDITGYS